MPSRKAITPVIAIVLLLMMTVAAAGLAYTFITSTQQETQNTVSSDIRAKTSMMSTCVSVDYAYENKAVIRNCGSGAVTTNSLVMIMDGALLNFTMSPTSINNGETAILNLSGLWAYSSGRHTLKAKSGMGQVASLDVIAEPRKDGLVGSWSFDEGTGSTAFDGSGSGNTGTLLPAGSEPQWVSGKFNKGLQFDSVDDYVDAGNGASLDVANAITVEAWINTAAFGTNQYRGIVGRRTGADTDGCGLQYGLSSAWGTGNQLEFWTHKAGVTDCNSLNYIVSSVISLNTWYHVVGTYDSVSGNQILYINGVQNSIGNKGAGTNIRNFSSQPLQIGRNPQGYWFFNGTIDEVRIWNKALAPDETVNIKLA